MSQSHCTSYYAATLNDPTVYPQLEGDVRVDIAIVGGGFTGVATAVELSEKGYKVALVEANRIGWGATGRNGGQITGSLSGDKAMLRHFGKVLGEGAKDFVWNLRWRGHDIIKKRVEAYQIDCDLKHGHLQTAFKPGHMRELADMYETACERGMGEQVKMISKADIPNYLETELYHGGILNNRNMHVHALNLCLGEARAAAGLGAQIFERSTVTRLEPGDTPRLYTDKGSITANTIMLAGNAYHKLMRRKLEGLLFPIGLGNLTTAPLGDEVANAINPHDLAVYDSRMVLDYYRLTADKRLMFGGGTNYSGRDPKDVAAELLPAIVRTFPRLADVKIDYQWTGRDGVVLNRIPQLGKLAGNIYYAQGYSGHGIALSHIVGEIMANALDGSLRDFDIFAKTPHVRLPFGEWAGNQMLAVGMFYYQMKEKLL